MRWQEKLLFSGSPIGAKGSTFIYSLIETAKANGLKSYTYLRYLFEQLPLAKTLDDYRRLLPPISPRPACL